MIEFKNAMRAPLDHLFNNHQWCKAEWCPVLKAQATNKPGPSASKYRCMEKDGDIRKQLDEIFEPFFADDKMKKMHHTYGDTQANEAMNVGAMTTAPKNKVYATTMSLENRLSIAFGKQILGWEEYWTRVFDILGIVMTENTRQMLRNRDKRKKYKQEYQASAAAKRRRAKANNEKIAEEIRKTERSRKRGSDYQSGIALEENQPAKKRQKNGKFD